MRPREPIDEPRPDDGTHVDVLAVLSGELPPAHRAAARQHLERCSSCSRELADLSFTVGELRDAARHRPVEPADVPKFRVPTVPTRHLTGPTGTEADARRAANPLPVEERPSRARLRLRRLVIAAAAAVVLIAGGTSGFLIGRSGRTPAAPSAAAVLLTPVAGLPSAAQGVAHMTGAGASQHMHLRLIGLPTPPRGDHYEVWLINTRSSAVLDVGAAPQSGNHDGVYAASAAVVRRYNAIDVSLQAPADGAQHSGHSVLRGTIA